jgi:pimeloyl-ACP methyl ester carboxylesterase
VDHTAANQDRFEAYSQPDFTMRDQLRTSTTGTTNSSAKFAQKPSVKIMRRALQQLEKVAPAFSARLVYRLISRPPRYRAHTAERDLATQARRWKLPFESSQIQCYQWGNHPNQNGDKKPLCLFVHSWGGRATQPYKLIGHLLMQGFSVVSFDHPGHGQSDRKSTEMIRMANAVKAVAAQFPVIDTLIGHSLGVAACTIALRDNTFSIKRLVSISSLTDCMWFTRVIAQYLGISEATIASARSIVDRQYAQPVGWEHLSVVQMMQTIEQPKLLIHDRDDQEIPFDHALEIWAANPDAAFLATNGLGHRRILKDQEVLERITSFAQSRQR